MYDADIVVCVYSRYNKLVNMIDLPRFLLRIVILAAVDSTVLSPILKWKEPGRIRLGIPASGTLFKRAGSE